MSFGWPCLPWPSSVSGNIPLLVHYLPVSMGIDVIPLPYMFLWRFTAKSLYLWSSPILSGCSDRHPQSKLQLPIFPPQGSFTGRLLGDCLAKFLLWHPLFITSQRGSLVWGGTGTPVPCMTVAHTQGNTNLWCNKKKPVSVEDSWPSMLVRYFIGGHIMICHDTSQVSSSHLSLIFLFPFQASTFTSTRSPGFKFVAPIFLL